MATVCSVADTWCAASAGGAAPAMGIAPMQRDGPWPRAP